MHGRDEEENEGQRVGGESEGRGAMWVGRMKGEGRCGE